MKFTLALTFLVAASQAVVLEHHHHVADPSTGAPIAICNGANSGACVEANEVVKHHIRRPFKRAAEGDKDYKEQEAADKLRNGGK